MDAQKFSAFLQARRKSLNLTQAALAEKLHVTDKAVSRWERGVGLPDINLLEPLAEALQISLTELIRSEKMEADTLTKDAADAAVAETLALAAKRRRTLLWWLSYALVCCIMAFFIGVITWFVDVPWVRMAAVFLIIQCGSLGMRLVEKILYPHKLRRRRSWKYYLKTAIFSAFLLLIMLTFFLQPRIGLQASSMLRLALAALLAGWGIYALWQHVKNMPTGKD